MTIKVTIEIDIPEENDEAKELYDLAVKKANKSIMIKHDK